LARIIDTSTSSPDDFRSPDEKLWVYNGYDCMLTAEIHDAIIPSLDNQTTTTYEFSKELQGPVLEMRLRGIRVDLARRAEVIDEYYDTIDVLDRNLQRIVLDGVGLRSFNWRSGPDLRTLFYDRLGIPPVRRQGRPTVNRDALEKIEEYLIARPIVRHLTTMRDIQKKIDFLKTGIDPDGRIRTSYNIAGTSTGRFSSSFSEFGTGGNLQNVEESLRSVLIADEGMKFAKFDGAQIQSRIVGGAEWNHVQDGTYLDACESGDLHTSVAKMTWPELPWTGDLIKDKKIASALLYRHHSYRYGCKVLGHGSNFDGQAETLATQTRIPKSVVEQFQFKYFRAFPGHKRWRNYTEDLIRSTGTYTAIGGRRRQFWGRRNDPKVIREALAYEGQSAEAHIVNHCLLNIWRARDVVLIMHEHDGLVVQYPEEQEDVIIPKVMKQLYYPVELREGRQLIIPFDCQTGWNRGKFHPEKNPDGLRDYKPADPRKRTPFVPLLDRILRK
jgi:DNA polymerase-1